MTSAPRQKTQSTETADVYRIRHYQLDGQITHTPITHAAYHEIVDVHRAGQVLLHIEETFEVVIANFIAWEETILSLSVRQLAGRHNLSELDYFDPARRDCHRALFNLLAVARAFDEQARSMIGDLPTPLDNDKAQVDAFFSREFDRALGYRVLCALRNHTQHQGLAVTGVSFGYRSVGLQRPRSAIVVRPYLHLDELRSSPKFKKATLAELEKHFTPGYDPAEDSFDLLPFVRAYVQGLSQVLVSIRDLVAAREALWRQTARSVQERYEGEIEDPERFAVCAEHVRGEQLSQERWIGSHPWRVIDQLRDKNSGLANLDIMVIQS